MFEVDLQRIHGLVYKTGSVRSSSDLQPSSLSMLVTHAYGDNGILTHQAALGDQTEEAYCKSGNFRWCTTALFPFPSYT